jgi:hypothetical protein
MSKVSTSLDLDRIAVYYNLEHLYGNKIYEISAEDSLSVFNMFHFATQDSNVYIRAPDEFIARIALLDLGYGIVK